MKEIKFRAWDKEVKTMYYEVQNVYDAPYVPAKTADGEDAELGCYYSSFGGILRDEVMAVMQYTGLKDKNGKEIYEGDIVNIANIYDETNFGGLRTYEKLEVKYDDFGWFPFIVPGGIDCSFVYSDADVEVIGNVWENPDLLT
jgi:uncharacterized phage protein (TIGR01671 family)